MIDLSNKTDLELLELMHKKTETSDLHIAAKHEYEKRKRKREFWSKNIVAWTALFISLCSLIVSIISIYIKKT
jgi:hypothetical protein